MTAATNNPAMWCIIRAMWGQRLADIAEATGISVPHVSRIAAMLELPSRKYVVRTSGRRHSERDSRLASVWDRSDMTDAAKAAYAGFPSVYMLRRRAGQLGLPYRPTCHVVRREAA